MYQYNKKGDKAGPGWIFCSRIGVFYTKFSITTPEFLFSFESQPGYLRARFLTINS